MSYLDDVVFRLGMAADSPAVLRALAAYLEKSRD